MAVLRLGAGLLLIPEQARFRKLCDRIADIFTSHGVTEAELLASLPEARRLGMHHSMLTDWLAWARRHDAKSTTPPNR